MVLLAVLLAAMATAQTAPQIQAGSRPQVAKPAENTAHVDLEVHLPVGKGSPARRPTVEVVAAPVGGERGALKIAIGPDGQGSALLEAGTWRLFASADGYWGPTAAFISVGEGRFPVVLKLIPTARVTGSLRFEREPEDIRLTACFRQPQSAPSAPGRDAVAGVVRCALPAKSVRFACSVPVGVHDLRIRADGHVSHFFRQQKVVADRPNDLGALRMTPGSSLVGQVTTDEGTPVEGADVLLTPDRADPFGVGALRLRTDAAGFFHFQGIQPGIFGLHVGKEGLLPLEIPGLSIRAGSEAEIAGPLTLELPARYQVSVTPPVDPQGEPWQVQLIGGTRLRRELTAIAPGQWQIENIPEGRYELLVLDAERNRVAREPIVLERGRELIAVDLELMSVVGSLTLGAQPLAGRVVFGSIQGERSVTLEVDEDGIFRGVVPKKERWDIDVMANSPAVVRRFRQVEGREEADEIMRFDLELPDTELAGRVVDADGEPVVKSLVIVLQTPFGELPSFQHTDAEGRFSLHGLGHSTYSITAEKVLQGTKRESAPVAVELAALSPSREVEIVLPSVEDVVRGKVVFDQGPVAGARVILRAPIVPGGGVSQATTGVDGGFELRVPPGTSSIRLGIQVTGSLMVRLRVARLTSDPIVVDLAGHQTGTLIISVDDSVSLDGSSPEVWARLPWLVDAASEVYSWGDLSSWAAKNGEVMSDGRLIVPFMPAGAYRLCRGQKPDCTTGTLLMADRLELSSDQSCRRVPAAGIGVVYWS